MYLLLAPHVFHKNNLYVIHNIQFVSTVQIYIRTYISKDKILYIKYRDVIEAVQKIVLYFIDEFEDLIDEDEIDYDDFDNLYDDEELEDEVISFLN